MNDKITENNGLGTTNSTFDTNSNVNITPVSSVDSYNASVNSNVSNLTNSGAENNVNNSLYTMNDINTMSSSGQVVDNGNFTMVNKNAVNTSIPSTSSYSASSNDGLNSEVTITETSNPNVGSSDSQNVEKDVNITITPTPENNNHSGGGKGKTILLILFFIVLFLFILFLPNISEIINTGNLPFKKNSEVQNGVLLCSMKNETDITDTTYEMRFTFNSKKLITSVLDVTVESEDKEVVNNKNIECQGIREVLVDGIEVECTLSGSISNTKFNYNYELIDNNNLTKFTEAGGVYPEHKYKENIYDIQSNMTKNGYDCEIRGN